MAGIHRFKLLSVVVLVLALVVGAGVVGQAQEQVVTIRAWTVGPDTPAFYRAVNLELAAERLNRMLADAGSPIRVEVDADFWTESWDSYRRRAILAFESGDRDSDSGHYQLEPPGHPRLGRSRLAGAYGRLHRALLGYGVPGLLPALVGRRQLQRPALGRAAGR